MLVFQSPTWAFLVPFHTFLCISPSDEKPIRYLSSSQLVDRDQFKYSVF